MVNYIEVILKWISTVQEPRKELHSTDCQETINISSLTTQYKIYVNQKN